VLQDRSPRDGSVGLSDLAAQVEVHAAHLARAFRRELGCTVGEYVRARNLEEAARLLQAGRLELVEVAHAVGYSDQSHFSNAFRRYFGVTPGRYRRTVRAR
jgi:AraC family transcriptional regulator